jgi:hypothetical protein
MYPFKYTLLFNSYFLTKTIPKMAQFLYLKRKSYKKGYSILYKKKRIDQKKWQLKEQYKLIPCGNK